MTPEPAAASAAAAPATLAERLSGPLGAALLMIAGMLLIPVGDSFAKAVSGATPHDGAAIAWARFATGALLVTPLALARGEMRGLTPAFWRAQMLRGALIAVTVALIITGASKAPLADVFGAFFVGPAVAILLARFVLGEAVRRVEWGAVALGFIGVAFVVRPGGEIVEGVIWALGAGLCYGAFLAATRWSAGFGPPVAQLGVQMAVAGVLLAPIGVASFAAHGVVEPGLLLGSGVTSSVANLLAIAAFRRARAAALAPLVYCQLISAAALSWAVFGDRPDVWTLLGLAIVASAGLIQLVPLRRR